MIAKIIISNSGQHTQNKSEKMKVIWLEIANRRRGSKCRSREDNYTSIR